MKCPRSLLCSLLLLLSFSFSPLAAEAQYVGPAKTYYQDMFEEDRYAPLLKEGLVTPLLEEGIEPGYLLLEGIYPGCAYKFFSEHLSEVQAELIARRMARRSQAAGKFQRNVRTATAAQK